MNVRLSSERAGHHTVRLASREDQGAFGAYYTTVHYLPTELTGVDAAYSIWTNRHELLSLESIRRGR